MHSLTWFLNKFYRIILYIFYDDNYLASEILKTVGGSDSCRPTAVVHAKACITSSVFFFFFFSFLFLTQSFGSEMFLFRIPDPNFSHS